MALGGGDSSARGSRVSASASARGRKPDRASAGMKGSTGVGGREEREKGRGSAGRGSAGRGAARVAEEEYPFGQRWGEGRRRFCRRGEGSGERGKR